MVQISKSVLAGQRIIKHFVQDMWTASFFSKDYYEKFLRFTILLEVKYLQLTLASSQLWIMHQY